MSRTLLIASVALIPACMLFSGSVALISRARTAGSLLQLIGAGSLVTVVLTHICEALQLFPWMSWGFEDSVGHYLDVSTAVLGATLFPAGYLFYALGQPSAAASPSG
mgnify:CR=1 FL=1